MTGGIPQTDLMLATARNVVWFKSPEEALADADHFLCHVMTFGDVNDVAVVRATLGADRMRQALDAAPPGIFDLRSWAYWQLVLNQRSPPPPLPKRRLP